MRVALTIFALGVLTFARPSSGFAETCDLGAHNPPTAEDAAWYARMNPPGEPDCQTKQRIQAAFDAQVPGGEGYLYIYRSGADWGVANMPYTDRPRIVRYPDGSVTLDRAVRKGGGTTYVLDGASFKIKKRLIGQ